MSQNYQTMFVSKGNLQIPSVLNIIWKKCFCLYGYKNLDDIHKEMEGLMLNT